MLTLLMFYIQDGNVFSGGYSPLAYFAFNLFLFVQLCCDHCPAPFYLWNTDLVTWLGTLPHPTPPHPTPIPPPKKNL